jgi:glycogen debranching enzyme
MAGPNSRYEPLLENARRELAANRLAGTSDWDGRKYDFVCPSAETYPFQWLWDSAFHAVSLLHVDPELAKQEVRCLLQGQQRGGFLPHMLLWDTTGREEQLAAYDIVRDDPHFTLTTQPPVLARAVERIYSATKDRAFVHEVLPALVEAFDWLGAQRDPDGDGLLSIIQPDESGLDASPKFDLPLGMSGRASLITPELREAMQRLFDGYQADRADQSAMLELDLFHVEEVMFNAIYGDGLRCLARLARDVQHEPELAAELDRRAVKVTTALMLKCWDQENGLFWDLWTREEKRVRVLTVASIFPLILEDLDPSIVRRLLKEHLLEPAEFWTRYPVPSVSVDEPSFDPSFRGQALWRGPTWLNVNWYLYWGLVQHGYRDIATELANRTFDLALRAGLREFYNPLTGEGLGAQDFSWSALVLDLLWGEGLLDSGF